MNELEMMVTEIRKALQEKASILNTLGECAPVQIWAKDLNHRYIYANSLHLEWLGVQEAAGLTDHQIAVQNRTLSSDPKYHTFGEVCGNSDVETLRQNNKCRFLEMGNVRGHFCALAVSKSPLINPAGKVVGTVGVAQDITDRLIDRESIYNELTFLMKSNADTYKYENAMRRFRNYCDRHKYTEGQI